MFEKGNCRNVLCGILLVALFACIAFFISNISFFKYISFSPLIIGIILGMIFANTFRKKMPENWGPGIVFCSKKVLRLAIILYGFRLTLQNVMSVGTTAIFVDLIIITGTIILGLLVGKLLKIDKDLSLLTATGSAICGAAAVLGAEPVLNNKPYKTAVAVSTVVIFGTISMFLYPALYRSGLLNLSAEQWGIYTGSTVHEVAHVVGAGNAMNDEISSIAIIVKMIRVIFFAPVLLIYAFLFSKRKKNEYLESETPSKATPITIPWFAFGFILMIAFNSADLLPHAVVDAINYFDTFLLTMAMTALGMETSFHKFKQAGFKPFLLAFILFLWLLFGGYFILKLM